MSPKMTNDAQAPEHGPLRIGELARRTGTGKATIKHYLNLGLLSPAWLEGQGYRLFDGDSIRRVGLIKKARLVGFGLPEVREMLRIVSLDELDELLTSLPPLRCREELRARGVSLASGADL